MTFTAMMFRLMAKRGDRKRDAGLTVPASVSVYRDLAYGPHGKWNLLDLYVPKDAPRRWAFPLRRTLISQAGNSCLPTPALPSRNMCRRSW